MAGGAGYRIRFATLDDDKTDAHQHFNSDDDLIEGRWHLAAEQA